MLAGCLPQLRTNTDVQDEVEVEMGGLGGLGGTGVCDMYRRHHLEEIRAEARADRRRAVNEFHTADRSSLATSCPAASLYSTTIFGLYTE